MLRSSIDNTADSAVLLKVFDATFGGRSAKS
jgi:hypothetical protein